MVLALLWLAGCSAIVSPDPDRLGGGGDGGVPVDGGRMDGGGPPDGGPPPDGTLPDDAGVRDVGPPADGGVGPFRPSNVSADLWDDGAPELELDRPGTTFLFDTSECRAEGAPSHVVPMMDGSEACVVQVRALRVREGSTLRVTGSHPVIFMVAGVAEIDGVIDVSAEGTEPGPGGGRGGVGDTRDGTGPAPGAGGEHIDEFQDGGGGGGALCGAGGIGGEGGMAAGGAGGDPLTGYDLIPLRGGSGGGRGRGAVADFGSNAGFGGGGGGSVQISARDSARVGGEVLAGGGGGGPGTAELYMYNWGAGGGGGSGGSILIESLLVELTGGAFFDAAGGGGGGSASGGRPGGAGQDGADTRDRAMGGTQAPCSSGTSCQSAAGGASGGAATLWGDPGRGNRNTSGNGGGGGGGAGCILIRTGSGMPPAGGARTPTVAPGYRTLPVLR